MTTASRRRGTRPLTPAHAMVLSALLAGCAPSAAGPAPVAVVLRGSADLTARIRSELAKPDDDVAIRLTDVAPGRPAPVPGGDVEVAIAEARKQYLVPDVPRCIAALPPAAITGKLLAAGRLPTVARILFWRVACDVAANALDDARRHADEFAALDLEVPADADAASPEVEAVIGRAIRDASAAAPSTLRAISAGAPLTVSIDGRATRCVTPCSVSVRPGAHYLHSEADGIVSEDRSVAVHESRAEVRFSAPVAPPDIAAQQWTLRYAASPSSDSLSSVRLLSQATRARNLVLLQADQRPSGTLLRGVLAVGGDVKGRAERTRSSGNIEDDVLPLVRELLVEGKVVESPSLTKRPLFWICVGVAAALAAGTTFLLTRPHSSRTEVRF